MAIMEPVVKVFICSIIASGVINFVHAQTGNDAKDLYTYLFTNQSYNARIRPANNQSLTTNISISLGLVSINGLDEVSETLTTTAFLVAEWYDDFLTWTPSSFGNIQVCAESKWNLSRAM